MIQKHLPRLSQPALSRFVVAKSFGIQVDFSIELDRLRLHFISHGPTLHQIQSIALILDIHAISTHFEDGDFLSPTRQKIFSVEGCLQVLILEDYWTI